MYLIIWMLMPFIRLSVWWEDLQHNSKRGENNDVNA